MSKAYALVDCNNFFVSCERVFQPKLANTPVAILSNNDGCIIARSNEIKQMGVPMGAPYYKWQQKIIQNGGQVLSSNYQLYGDMSNRVMSCIAKLAPKLEIYSIDEAFIQLDGMSTAKQEQFAIKLSDYITKCTGIPVSIGVAATKTLAKIANFHAKKSSCSYLVITNQEQQQDLLNTTEVADIWGVGRRWGKKLRERGIYTAGQLSQQDSKQIRRAFSVIGERLVLELQGFSCLSLETIAPRKNIIASRSFGTSVDSIEVLEEAVSSYVSRACVKLRGQQSRAQAIYVYIRTNKFSQITKQYYASKVIGFDNPTSDTREISYLAKQALRQIYQKNYKYHKAGIMLMDLVPNGQEQTNLFVQKDHSKSDLLMQTIDSINKLHGRGTLKFAAEGLEQSWAMRNNLRSPRFTTNWEELLEVK